MGCWNKTCIASNLHILASTPVTVFAIVQYRGYRSWCYTTSLYSPILLPFYGTYDDYGGSENNTGEGISLIIEAIKGDLFELDVGLNPCHDIAVKKADFDEKLLFEAVHEDRLYVTDPTWPDAVNRVQLVMIHGTVWDEILKNHRINYSYLDQNKQYVRTTYGFDDILADVPAFLEEAKQLTDTTPLLH